MVLLARFAKTRHDGLEDDGIDLGRADVVHEEERQRTLHEDVVDAVVHDVLPDGVVLVHHRGDLELRAHAVGRGDEYLVLAGRDLVEAAERADVADDGLRLGSRDHLLDGTDRVHLDVDVDACLRVRRLLL